MSQTSEQSKPDDMATTSGLFGRTTVGIIISYFDVSSPGSSRS